MVMVQRSYPLGSGQIHRTIYIYIENNLSVDTSIHWHGQRVVNAVDGVPGLTQAPIKPGETFHQTISFPDPGTYWYHPHLDSQEAVGRGLISPLIIEEEEPIAVDHDLTALVSRHIVGANGKVLSDFGEVFPSRWPKGTKNTWFINGRKLMEGTARAGETVRLRIINGSTMWPFFTELPDFEVFVAAIDGHPLSSPIPLPRSYALWPGQRYDLLFTVPDCSFSLDTGVGFSLLNMHVIGKVDAPRPLPRLPTNPIAPIDLQNAKTIPLKITRREQSGFEKARAAVMTKMGKQDNTGMDWFFNGATLTEASLCSGGAAPLFHARKGQTVRIKMENTRINVHPMHLHGHSCFTISPNGEVIDYGAVRDTVNLLGNSKIEIAFVADNPGRWMLHCHDLRHQAQGMMGYFAVV
ncbi:MAG: multicopper oxidase family protein [Pseudomonadota bacterium]